ncbi:MAG: PKD domain-containing protein [Bacteroidetes bacterium]|nr:PKD domain-containing protein [Bacteroidota bacterium]
MNCFSQVISNSGAVANITSGTVISNASDVGNTSGTISNSGTITMSGNLTNSGTINGSGLINLPGNLTNNATFTGNSVTFNGTTSILGSAVSSFNDVTIAGGSSLTAYSGNMNIAGNFTNNGTFTHNSGTATFNGSSAQTIGGGDLSDFYNITLNNSSGASILRDEHLINTLTISNGTFTTTGYDFTLLSNSSGTARIAAIPSGANLTGNINMLRYTGTGPTDWRFLGAPVSGATIADWADDFATSGFTGSTCPACAFKSIYWYDETQPGDKDQFGYVAATNVTNPLYVGRGYWVYLGPNPKTFAVKNTPNKFTQSIPVTFTSSSAGITHDGWNLVSNPYPCALDWNSANWTKTKLDNAIYIYNSSTGSYASYVSGVGVNGGTQYIPSSQAFWVHTNAASPVLTAVENVKSTSANPVFLKTNPQNISHYPLAFKDFPVPLNANTIPNSIKLTAKGGGYEDETFIRFLPGATDSFDVQYDAYKMWGTLNLASVINDSLDLSINSLPDLTSDVTVKMRLTIPTNKSGNYSIRRDSTLMLPMSSCLILEDLANGSMTDLRANISYSFTISDTTAAPRFLLHVYAPITKQAVNTHCASDSTGMAIAMGTGSGPWTYTWKDSIGTILKTTISSSTADTLFNLPKGLYWVEVSSGVCGTVKDTLRINSSSNLLVMVNYSDVSCYGANDGSAYTTLSGGIAPFTYSWSSGQTASAITNLSAGNYSVTVIDSNGCSQTQFIIISQPNLLAAAFTPGADTVNLFISGTDSFTNTSSGALSWLWNFGDGSPADTAMNTSHTYTAVGTYTVMLIAQNGNCSDTSYKVIEVIYDNLTGANVLFTSSDVNVMYGNGEVYLDFDLPAITDVSISIYSLLGEKIGTQYEEHIRKKRVRLETSLLSAGIYISVSSMKEAVISKKIMLPGR